MPACAIERVRPALAGPPPARGRRAKSRKRSIKLVADRSEPSGKSQAGRAKREEPSGKSQAGRAKREEPSRESQTLASQLPFSKAISVLIQSPGRLHPRLVAPAQAGAQRLLPRAGNRPLIADGRSTSCLARSARRQRFEAWAARIPSKVFGLDPAPRPRRKRKHRVPHTVRTTGPMASANQLAQMVGREGFEPSTYGLKVRSSTAELTTR